MAEKAEEEMMARLSVLKAGFDGDADAVKEETGAFAIKGLDLDAYDVEDASEVGDGLDGIEKQMRKMDEHRKSLSVPAT